MDLEKSVWSDPKAGALARLSYAPFGMFKRLKLGYNLGRPVRLVQAPQAGLQLGATYSIERKWILASFHNLCQYKRLRTIDTIHIL
ncbi:MAG: hypothetical protein A2036_04350 [Omnitrophica bacterium GWA2_50_21]|nr:MAG: hypothetical protein A2036_04350 [Omnitrophica bacterium GWA2_50_21]